MNQPTSHLFIFHLHEKDITLRKTGILLDFIKHLVGYRTDTVDLMAQSKAKNLLSRWDEIKEGAQDLTLTDIPSILVVKLSKRSILE